MTNTSQSVTDALQRVQSSIQELAHKHGRDPGAITLLAVSKTKTIAQVQEAIDAGQQAFGENYPDEAFDKISTLNNADLQWHFIGGLQSRKAAGIAQHFSWVHSVDRLKVINKLATARPDKLPPLQVCLQVNIDNESSKSGAQPEELLTLANACAEHPQLSLRGLMAIPAPQTEYAQQRASFHKVRTLLHELQQTHPQLDTLSMGMSGDLDAAIAEGATIVRVGTAIFGARAPKN